MSAASPEELELIEKHEEILGQRAELLEQMERRRQQLDIQRKRQGEESEAATHRNNTLIQDLQKLEHCLGRRQLPRPNLLALETQYWASVEESLPAWEHFLLGKGPHPTDGAGQPARTNTHQARPATPRGLPPRPKPRTIAP